MTTSSVIRVILERQDCETQELRIDQINVENLRRLFQVNPTETWLKDELEGTLYFPQQNGSFDLASQGIARYTTLIVEGPSLQVTQLRSNLPPARGTGSLSSTPDFTPSSSGFQSVIQSRRPQSYSLKVIKAEIIQTRHRKKIEFKQITQTFIELMDSTANVEYILSVVQRRWGPDFIIVTHDGLPIEESPATQGLAFWKCPKRKVFAIKKGTDSSDEDANTDEPKPKKIKKTEWEEMAQDLGGVAANVEVVKEQIKELLMCTTDSKVQIPLALKNSLKENFKCRICHSLPIKPPVMISRCCRNLLGCESCCSNWYSGLEAMSKRCPLCRAERGLSETMRLIGLDDFLEILQRLFNDSPGNEEESS